MNKTVFTWKSYKEDKPSYKYLWKGASGVTYGVSYCNCCEGWTIYCGCCDHDSCSGGGCSICHDDQLEFDKKVKEGRLTYEI